MLGLLTAGLGLSCTKTFDEKLGQQKNFTGTTIAQVHMAMVGITSPANALLTIDASPVSASTMVSGSVFPGTGYGFNVPAGVRAFMITGTAPLAPFTFAENMQPGKHQTIFIYDTTTSPKQKTVIDNIVIPTDTTSRLRFANFVYNPYAIPNVDVFSWKANANLWTNIPVTGVTDYVVYPSLVTDTLYIRETGTSNQVFKLTIGGGVTPKRNYTLSYRGSYRGTRTTTLFANY